MVDLISPDLKRSLYQASRAQRAYFPKTLIASATSPMCPFIAFHDCPRTWESVLPVITSSRCKAGSRAICGTGFWVNLQSFGGTTNCHIALLCILFCPLERIHGAKTSSSKQLWLQAGFEWREVLKCTALKDLFGKG